MLRVVELPGPPHELGPPAKMWRGATRRVETGSGALSSGRDCSNGSGRGFASAPAPALAEQVDSENSDQCTSRAEADRTRPHEQGHEPELSKHATPDRDADSHALRWPMALLLGGRLRPWHHLGAIFILVQLYIATRAHLALYYGPSHPGQCQVQQGSSAVEQHHLNTDRILRDLIPVIAPWLSPGAAHRRERASPRGSEEPAGSTSASWDRTPASWHEPGGSMRQRLLLSEEQELLHCQGDLAHSLSHTRQLLSIEESRIEDETESGLQGSRRRLLGRTRRKKVRRLRKKKAPSELRKHRLNRAALANVSSVRSRLSLPILFKKALPRSRTGAQHRGTTNATTGASNSTVSTAKATPTILSTISTIYPKEATTARRRLSSFAKDTASSAADAGHLDLTLAQLLRQRFQSCSLTDRLNPNVYWKVCGNQMRKDNRSVVIYSFSNAVAKDANLTQFQRDFRSYGHKVLFFNPLLARQQPEGEPEEGTVQEEEPEDQGGGPLLAKLAVKPFGLSLYDGVKPVVAPIPADESGQGTGDSDQSAVSLASKQFLVEPHNDTGLMIPALRLKTLMCIFKHAWVDVVQLDLGGAEIELCDARGGIFAAGTPAGARRAGWVGGIPVGQFVVKFNEGVIKEGQKRRHRCEKHMDSAGYKVAHRRPDNRMVVFARMGPREGKGKGKGKAKK